LGFCEARCGGMAGGADEERMTMKAYFLWLAKLLTLLVVVLVVVPLLLGSVMIALQSQVAENIVPADKMVAVVEMKGAIESAKEVVDQLYKQAADTRVKGIVLRIESPGGGVGPSQEIYEAVSKLKEKKPIVASMGSVAASGGLYAALGASRIFCQPGTLTGSIGVVMQVPNFTKITQKVGVEMLTIKSGKFKDVGNSFRDMTDDDRQLLQSTVNDVNDDFIDAVVQGRKLERARVVEFADGRVILGSQALKLKLVDKFGGVYDAAELIHQLKF
jgi:protease IV